MLEGLEPPKSKTKYCKVDITLSDLEDTDRKLLIEMLSDTDKWGHSPLSRALRSRGVELSDTTIAKHRSAECTCYR